LPTNTQNFTQKDSTEVKIFQKVSEGLLFRNTLYLWDTKSYTVSKRRVNFGKLKFRQAQNIFW